jgi:hypothetical protein
MHSSGIAVPIGNALIYSAPRSTQRECRLSVVAKTTSSTPGLGDWIIEKMAMCWARVHLTSGRRAN